MREDKFLNIIKEILPESSGYIGDDTAYLSEKDLILTQDTLIEDIHFRTSTINPYYLGRKAVAANLSDIAASGGVPGYILISLSMPKIIDDDFIKQFYKGVDSICKEYNVLVVGGDLTAAQKITVSVCVIGFGKGLIPANRRNSRKFLIISGQNLSMRILILFPGLKKDGKFLKSLKSLQSWIQVTGLAMLFIRYV